MQSLPLADRFFSLVLSGQKTNTMRWREPRIVPGPLRYFSEANAHPDIIVDVIRCTDVPLHAAAALVGIEADWPDEKMLTAMRLHYPAITLASIVQVIEHEGPNRAAL